jgi:hypothetical protein
MLVLDQLLQNLRDGGAEFVTMEAAATACNVNFPFGS